MPALRNHKHERFAQLVGTGSTATAAHREAYGDKGKSNEQQGCRFTKDRKIAARIEEIRQGYARHVEKTAVRSRFLTLDAKREFLAKVVETPIGQITEASELCQSSEATKFGRKLKMPCKLKAIELDARLAGEFVEKVEVKADGLLDLLKLVRHAD